MEWTLRLLGLAVILHGLLVLSMLFTGCSTYGRAVTTLMTPAAKATTKAVYPDYQWPHGQQPQEKPPCTALTPCP
jgi:hypothetical protein